MTIVGWYSEVNLPTIVSVYPLMREIISLACTECKRRNYTTTKNKKRTPKKLELKKYCKFDRKHTLHRETK